MWRGRGILCDNVLLSGWMSLNFKGLLEDGVVPLYFLTRRMRRWCRLIVLLCWVIGTSGLLKVSDL